MCWCSLEVTDMDDAHKVLHLMRSAIRIMMLGGNDPDHAPNLLHVACLIVRGALAVLMGPDHDDSVGMLDGFEPDELHCHDMPSRYSAYCSQVQHCHSKHSPCSAERSFGLL